MLKLGSRAARHIDQLRPGLLHVIIHRLRAFNANTQLLLRLLEEPDWRDFGSRALNQIRNRVLH